VPSDEIVVLANSKKLNGRCVAGISTKSGKWVRPVSDLPRGELKPHHYEIDDRSPEVLDIVRFGFEEHLEDPIQPENVLLNDDEWQSLDRLDPKRAYRRLRSHISTDPLLFGDNGKYIAEDVAEEGVDESLTLVEPEDELEFRVRGLNGGRQARVVFRLGSEQYDLPVTDPVAEGQIKAAGVGRHAPGAIGFPTSGRVLLTVSLGEPFEDCCWKLVAAVVFLG
jgi:hypothetical protein